MPLLYLHLSYFFHKLLFIFMKITNSETYMKLITSDLLKFILIVPTLGI